MRSYEQRSIGGGATVHTIRAWRPGELDGKAKRKLPTHPPLKRLHKVRAQVAAGIEAAGSIGAYYDSGGLAGPFGRALGRKAPSAGRRKASTGPSREAGGITRREAGTVVAVIGASACPHCGGTITTEVAS